MHLFEMLEGVKNLNDPNADDCEKVTIEQAKAGVGIAAAITEIYKTQLNAIEIAHKMDDISDVKTIVKEMGIADTKMLGQI